MINTRWVILITPAVLASQVNAQDSPSPQEPVRTSATTLDAVQVTAQFRVQNMQETPIAISALSAEMMDARGQFSVLDVASAVPGVNIQPMTGFLGPGAVVSIRGVGQNDSSFALEPGVGIYIDDVYHPTMVGSAFDLLDLERVEVLRGPQGTLAGKNSVGGAIKLYSRVPDEYENGALEATVGAFGRLDLRAASNLVLNPERLFLRLSGVSKRRDGYITRYDYGCLNPGSGILPGAARGDCILGYEGGERYQGVRAALRWLAHDRLEVNLIADASGVNNEGTPAVLLAGGTDSRFLNAGRFSNYATYAGNFWHVSPDSVLDARGVSAKIDWKINDQYNLTSISSYREYKGHHGVDVDLGPDPFYHQQWQFWNHTFSQELRLNGMAFKDKLQYTLGGYYFDAKSNMEGIVDILFFFAYHDDPVVAKSKSAFAHAMYQLSDWWDVSAGVRFTDESKSYTFTRLDPFTRLPATTFNGQTGYYQGNRWDYRLATSWHFNDDVMLYASLATGFKGGGVNPRPFSPGQVVPFAPEVLRAYEIGIKSDLLDRRLRLNTSVFLNDYSSILMTITNGYGDFPVSAIPLNVGEADVRGAEIELTAYPVEGLMLDASYGYLDFEFKKLSTDALASGVEYWMVSPYMSKHQASLGLQYELNFTRGSLVPRLDASYWSQFYTLATNTALGRVDGATLASAKISWRPRNADWELVAGATNLFNRYYYNNAFDVLSVSGVANANPARPREWFVTMKYEF